MNVQVRARVVRKDTMSQINFIDEIQDLNLAYLLLAQRLLGEDRETAMFRLKIDGELAELLVGLNARQLAKLARTNQLLCRLCPVSAEQVQQVVDNPRDQGLAGLHTSLLLATHRRESVSAKEPS